MEINWRCEVSDKQEQVSICGYIIHPAAAVFPLIEGDEFDNLVESIINNGIHHPIVIRRGTDADELIDGRNRLRAAEAAREQGHKVSVPVVEWNDDGRNVAEWIWDTNAMRRQMNDDGIAVASAAIWPLIAKENEAKKEATQFKKGASGNPDGKKQVTKEPSSPAKRDRKKSDAASTAGQVAKKGKTSLHKARQAIAVQKAIASGELPADTAKDVMSGKKKLKDVAPKPARKTREKKHRAMKEIIKDFRDLIAEWMEADHNREVLKDELKTHVERL